MSTITNGVYFIQNVKTATVIDLQDGSSENETPIHGHKKRDISDTVVGDQLWIVVQLGNSSDHTYTIENARSATYMDIHNGSSTNGTAVVGIGPSGQQTQHWVITRNSANNGYVIKNQATGTYVNLDGGHSEDGTAINGWAGAGATETNTQRLWNFVRV